MEEKFGVHLHKVLDEKQIEVFCCGKKGGGEKRRESKLGFNDDIFSDFKT